MRFNFVLCILRSKPQGNWEKGKESEIKRGAFEGSYQGTSTVSHDTGAVKWPVFEVMTKATHLTRVRSYGIIAYKLTIHSRQVGSPYGCCHTAMPWSIIWPNSHLTLNRCPALNYMEPFSWKLRETRRIIMRNERPCWRHVAGITAHVRSANSNLKPAGWILLLVYALKIRWA